MKKLWMAMLGVLLVSTATGQESPDRTVIENDGRRVVFTDDVPASRTGYNSPWQFSHAIRAGDFVHISGIIIGASQDDTLPIDMDRFREHTEAAFETIEAFLDTADAGLAGMVKINTFHVLDGEATELTIAEQSRVIAETKAKYAVEPHPAWTAVGTTGLFSPRGIVEIEMVVYAPPADAGSQ